MSAPPARRIMLFGKVPAAGHAKTRLAPLLGEAGAADLYAAFLEDTAKSARDLPGTAAELWLEPPATDALPALSGRTAGERLARRLGLPVRWQRGEDLGERLRAAFDRAFAEDGGAAIAVGTDHPTLPTARLRDAFGVLEEVDAVIGPSEDGGYYLIGLRRAAWPRASDLFREMPWSSPDLLARTRAAVASIGLAAREIPAWYDVDEASDLGRLVEDLDPASRTAAALARLLRGAGG